MNQWHALLATLRQWQQDAPDDEYHADGVVPNLDTISRARNTLATMQESKIAPPTWVVQDGRGGIVFETVKGAKLTKVHIRRNGPVEGRMFWNNRLMKRCEFTEPDVSG